MTEQAIERIRIRSVSDHLRPLVRAAGFGESRRSIAKADGTRVGVGPHAN
jgi:hypothetical protein